MGICAFHVKGVSFVLSMVGRCTKPPSRFTVRGNGLSFFGRCTEPLLLTDSMIQDGGKTWEEIVTLGR
eukprot:3854142-Rhodomonas_salina.1